MKRHFTLLRRFRRLLSPADRKERRMRSNPIRDAILNLLEDRLGMEGTTAAEVLNALQVDPPLDTVAYHLQVLANNGRLKRDDSQTEPRFQLTS